VALIKRILVFLLSLVFIIIFFSVTTSLYAKNKDLPYGYFMSGLQDKTCEDVKAYAEKFGYASTDWWSGTAQTIAYYSYEIGCSDLYYKALKAGADPTYGGYFGDLVGTIITESTEKNSNDPNACKNGEDWLTLIKNTGADLKYRYKFGDLTIYTNIEILEMIDESDCKGLKRFFM